MCCSDAVCLQWAATSPPKMLFPFSHGSLSPSESPPQTASRSVQPSLQGSRTNVTNRQTDRQTERPTTLLLWPNDNNDHALDECSLVKRPLRTRFVAAVAPHSADWLLVANNNRAVDWNCRTWNWTMSHWPTIATVVMLEMLDRKCRECYWLLYAVTLSTARRYASAVYAVALALYLSVCHKPVLYQNG